MAPLILPRPQTTVVTRLLAEARSPADDNGHVRQQDANQVVAVQAQATYALAFNDDADAVVARELRGVTLVVARLDDKHEQVVVEVPLDREGIALIRKALDAAEEELARHGGPPDRPGPSLTEQVLEQARRITRRP